MQHSLKTWPKSFQAMLDGAKHHEVRPADRPYKVGDKLFLQEWVPAHEEPCAWERSGPYEAAPKVCSICGRKQDEPLPGTFTGRVALAHVTYITPPGKFGMPTTHLVMSIELQGAIEAA